MQRSARHEAGRRTLSRLTPLARRHPVALTLLHLDRMPEWTDVAVRGSIGAATVSWAAAEWLRWRQPERDAAARALWTAGAVLTTLHVIAVFQYIHHWSHDAAIADTARQTAQLTGFNWGGGLYVNYAFIALWVIDAALWWRDRLSYARRSAVHRNGLLAIFLFMFVNGGIVFARGTARAIGVAGVSAVLWARYSAVRMPAMRRQEKE
jgi:hypothetical protein